MIHYKEMLELKTCVITKKYAKFITLSQILKSEN